MTSIYHVSSAQINASAAHQLQVMCN